MPSHTEPLHFLSLLHCASAPRARLIWSENASDAKSLAGWLSKLSPCLSVRNQLSALEPRSLSRPGRAPACLWQSNSCPHRDAVQRERGRQPVCCVFVCVNEGLRVSESERVSVRERHTERDSQPPFANHFRDHISGKACKRFFNRKHLKRPESRTKIQFHDVKKRIKRIPTGSKRPWVERLCFSL